MRQLSDLKLINYGKCPNDHEDMVFFNHPIDILYHVPEDLMEPLEGKDTPPGMYGYIVAICQECGFILSLERIDNLHEYLSWLKDYRSSSDSPPKEVKE